MKNIYLFLITLMISFSYASAQEWIINLPESSKSNYYEIQKSFNDYWKDRPIIKGHGYKQFKRLEYFFQDRLMEDGSAPDFFKINQELIDYKNKNKDKNNSPLADADWKFIGPSSRPVGTGIGRVNSVLIDPNDDNIIYAGAAFGGLWKSSNGGANWSSLLDNQFQSIGVSSIAISKSNSNIIYAVTGDADAAGIFGSNWCYSIGLIKSTNGGLTWTSTGLTSTLTQQTVIYKVIVNPENANIIYVAGETGLKKSIDGGINWSSVTASVCRDIIYHPTNPQIVYGVFKNATSVYEFRVYNESTQSLTVKETILGSARVALAVSKAEPNSAWAVAVSFNMGFNSIWKTTNNGDKWNKLCDNTNTPNLCGYDISGTISGGQGVYDLAIAVSNSNANEVYVGGINMWKSTNSGTKWTCVTDWTGASLPYLHADQHHFSYNSSNVLYVGNDGGVTKTTNGGSNWFNISDGLGISQFYKISTAKLNGNFITGGTQDNGTMMKNGASWSYIQTGDGMATVIDPNDQNLIYASFYGNDGVINFTKSTNAGQTFTVMINKSITNEYSAWVAPIVIHPTNSNILYVGYQNIWKSTNKGASWTKSSSMSSGVIKAITICKANTNYMYCTNGSTVFQSSNSGSTWTGIYSSGSPAITNILVDPNNAGKIWITHGGYSATKKVVIWEDGTTTNITGTLPNIPTNCIALQDNSPNRIYLGTDVGVFTRDDNSNDWVPFNTNLPNIVVLDLNIHSGSGLLRAATYARGLWETKINNCNLASPSIIITGDTTFCVGDSVTLEVNGTFPSYNWSNGSKLKKITIKTSGKYSVIVTDVNNCTATSREINISSNTIPDIKITSSSTSFCDGDSLALTASLGFGTYNWSNGLTGRKIFVKSNGNYKVTGLTSAGCSNSAEITVSMNPKPPKPNVIRNGDIITSTDATSYQWYFNGTIISGANNKTFTLNKSGKYKVEITDGTGCKNISDEYSFEFQTVELSSDNNLIQISPNPNTGEFSIILKENFVLKNLEILNQFGENVDVLINNNVNSFDVNLKNNSNGIYYLRFLIKNQVYVVKIIKNI